MPVPPTTLLMASASRLPLWIRMSTPSVDAIASTPVNENSLLRSSRFMPKNWYQPKLKVTVPIRRFNTLNGKDRPGDWPICNQWAGATVRGKPSTTRVVSDSRR